jgi:hypothetical protein
MRTPVIAIHAVCGSAAALIALNSGRLIEYQARNDTFANQVLV